MFSFNLIYEPFLQCHRTNGEFEWYGLRDVLVNAHDIVELRDASPLVTVAVHRLLLAILHRVYAGPKTAAARLAIRDAGRFDDPKITAYLEKWKGRFDLFHDKHPFYQQAGFQTAAPSGLNRLAQELSCGNNAALFDHTTDDPPPSITPAQAAHGLIAEQAFAVGGGKSETGYTSHAPLVGGAVVLVRGATLFETLWLNLTIYSDRNPIASLETDVPVWERPAEEAHTQIDRPRGYLDYLTWQSRTLRLHVEEGGEGLVVRRVSYAQGRKFDPPAGFYDPMMAYSRSERDGDRAIRFNEYRDLWRDSAALFQFGDTAQFRGPTILHTLKSLVPSSSRCNLSVFGICTDKAKVNFWRHESLPLPLAYLDEPALVESLKFALKLAEEVAYDALRKAAWATVANRLTGDTGMNPDKDRVQSLLDSFAPQPIYWSRLERPYRELLVALADAASTEARTALVTGWFDDTLRPTAIDAFDRSVGQIDAGRDLKATTVGRGLLLRSLSSIRTKNKLPVRPDSQEDAE